MCATALLIAGAGQLAAQTIDPDVIEFAPSPDHSRMLGGTTTLQVSAMTWAAETNGWGPAERNRSNGEMGSADGRTITLNGVAYATGVGVHSSSEVRVAVPAGCTRFLSDVGVDDEVGNSGSGVFEVMVDGTVLFNSGVMNGASATRQVSVDVTGRSEVRLLLQDGGDNRDFDHGDWANARFSCGVQEPIVKDYAIAFYEANALEPFRMVSIGKPNPQADGLIRADLAPYVSQWPAPGVDSVARVVAQGSGGPGVSLPSNTFQYRTADPANVAPAVAITRPVEGATLSTLR